MANLIIEKSFKATVSASVRHNTGYLDAAVLAKGNDGIVHTPSDRLTVTASPSAPLTFFFDYYADEITGQGAYKIHAYVSRYHGGVITERYVRAEGGAVKLGDYQPGFASDWTLMSLEGQDLADSIAPGIIRGVQASTSEQSLNHLGVERFGNSWYSVATLEGDEALILDIDVKQMRESGAAWPHE